MKRIITLMLALFLVFSMATTAFAATTSGTITNATDRAYKAYQIFSGTQADENDVLGNIAWGTGINNTSFLGALKALSVNGATPFSACTDAVSVAAVLKNGVDNDATTKAFADLAAKHLSSTATDVGANAASTSLPSGYWLLVDQTNVANADKAKNPALLQVTNGSLTITDKSGKSSLTKTVNDGDVADVSIGDTVTFTLTATMPATYEGYDKYMVIFHDTMSAGLTIDKDSVAITGIEVDLDDCMDIDEETTGTTLTITIDDVIGEVATGGTITVTYEATLNSGAVIGGDGNTNKAYLEYSNDPNSTGTGSTGNGKTTEDEVKVYTWNMEVLKYADGDETKTLDGVKFILLNQQKTKVAKVESGVVTGWFGLPTDNIYTNYELATAGGGKISVAGLGSGTYYLRETEALPGYNQLTEDQEFTVTGNTANPSAYQKAIAKVNNNSGATLPETGGVGTTLFYVVGGLMMLAAVVLLVTKKRMVNAD